MKTLKLITAGIFAVGLASMASAQVVVNVCGSTAFRNAVTAQEVTLLSHTGTNLPGGSAFGAYTTAGKSFSASGSGASQSIVHGYLSDGVTEVYFRNDWTGSLSGAVDLTQGNTALTFIPTTATLSVTSGGGTQYTGTLQTGAPSFAFCDVSATDIQTVLSGAPNPGPSYASTIGATSALTNAGTSGGAGPAGTVAAVTFQWVLGKHSDGNPDPFSNITQQQASALIQYGIVPLSVFTGNQSDDTNFVVWIGRNEDSGTRILSFAEAQGGGLATASAFGQNCAQFVIKQASLGYPSNFSSTSVSVDASGINGFKLWPTHTQLNTETALSWPTSGHSGYTSGGDVANILSSPNPVNTSGWSTTGTPPTFAAGTSKVYIVSNLGTNDALTAVKAGASPLSYNGVSFLSYSAPTASYNSTALQEGLYSNWSYEHAYYLTSGTGTQNPVGSGTSAQAACDQLADAIYNTTTANILPFGVQISSLDNVRASPAGSNIQ